MKQHFFKRFFPLFLVLALLSNSLPASVNASESPTGTEMYTYWNDGETKVVGYVETTGDKIFLQYVNGILVQKNTIRATDPSRIYQEYFPTALTTKNSSERDIAANTSILNIDDVIQVSSSMPTSSITVAAASQTAGTINYRTPTDNGTYYYYSLVCSHVTSPQGYTTYTINGFLGAVVDLVSLLVGALSLPLSFANSYIAAPLQALAIEVIGGIIKTAVTDTVSCSQTDYIWTLRDKYDSTHSKTVSGSQYYINDFNAAMSGRTYYDAYTPHNWRTQSLAVWFHNEMYSHSVWEVYSWG